MTKVKLVSGAAFEDRNTPNPTKSADRNSTCANRRATDCPSFARRAFEKLDGAKSGFGQLANVKAPAVTRTLLGGLASLMDELVVSREWASDMEKVRRWYDPLPHTHVAVEDALEQGALFCNMLAELQRNHQQLAAK